MWPLHLDVRSQQMYERFVPPDHPLRRLAEAVDFSFVLNLVADRDALDNGRPTEHPERTWRSLVAENLLTPSVSRVGRRPCSTIHATG